MVNLQRLLLVVLTILTLGLGGIVYMQNKTIDQLSYQVDGLNIRIQQLGGIVVEQGNEMDYLYESMKRRNVF